MPHSLAASGAITDRNDYIMARSEAQKAAEKRYEAAHKKERAERSALWLFEFYPEGNPPAPENWREIISSWLVDCLVSPLHDSDVDPDGTPKKPHWHAILSFDSPKSLAQVVELIAPLNGPKPIKPKGSMRNCAAYLIHKNNPDKYQYSADDVTNFGGIDFREALLRSADKYGFIGEMMDFCDDQGIRSYAQLLRYARAEREEWFRCLCDNGTYVMKEYLKTAAYDERR